jgi:hypothetical protein
LKKIGTKLLEAIKMWMESKWKTKLMSDLWLKKKLNRMSRQTRYSVVLKPTIGEDELYTFLNTHVVYDGTSRFVAGMKFNWHYLTLKAGMTVQTIVMRGWTKDEDPGWEVV